MTKTFVAPSIKGKRIADTMVDLGEMILRNTPRGVLDSARELGFDAVPEIRRRIEEMGMDYDSYKDSMATYEIARTSQTIIFPIQLVEQFLEMTRKGRIDLKIPFRLPFAQTTIQFDGSIPETEFFPDSKDISYMKEKVHVMTGGILEDYDDDVLGILLSVDEHPGTKRQLNTVIAIYETGSVQRVAWWDSTGEYNTDVPEVPENKLRLRQMSLAVLSYLNAENVLLHQNSVAEKVNRKRRKKGKGEIKPFYTTYIRKMKLESAADRGKGVEHSFMYPVRGHVRRFEGGRSVWVTPHYRGIEHGEESLRKKDYKVSEVKRA